MTQTIPITSENINEYFDVTNGSYYFAGSGSTFAANNTGKNSSTATTSFTAKQDIDVTLNYSYVTERNYDKFTLKAAGTTLLNAVSGTSSGSQSFHLSTGQKIELSYSKDSSSHASGEKCEVSGIAITSDFRSAPETPTNFRTTSIGGNSVTLAWNASTDVDGYRLYRNGTQIYNGLALSFADTSLSPGTTYTYMVVAYNTAGESAPATVSATPQFVVKVVEIYLVTLTPNPANTNQALTITAKVREEERTLTPLAPFSGQANIYSGSVYYANIE